DENYMDMSRRIDIDRLITELARQNEETKAAMEDAGNEMLKYAIFGLDNPLYKLAEREMLDFRVQGSAIIDSIHYYLQQDSIIAGRIASRKDPKTYYLGHAFVKATATDNNTGKSYNLLDTVSI